MDFSSVLAIVGAAVLLIAGWILRDRIVASSRTLEAAIRTKVAGSRRDRRRARYTQAKIAATADRVFAERGWSERLYSPRSLESVTTWPLLFDPESLSPVRVDELSDDPFHLTSLSVAEMAYDRALIKRREADGARLWDGPVLFHDPRAQSSARYPVGVTNYFAPLTVADSVVRELARSTGSHPLVEGQLSSFARATSPAGPRPLGIGADVACVFDSPAGRVVAIHKRSEAVVNAAGLLTLSPAFTMEANASDSDRSRFGLTYYNFAKEFLEEFWGKPQLSEANVYPRSQPDWVLRGKVGRSFLREVEEQRVALYLCGVAVDLTQPNLLLGLVAHFTSPTYLDFVKEAPGSEHEIQKTLGELAIRFVGLHSQEMTALMTLDKMKVTSLFALDCARAMFDPDDEQAETRSG